MHAQTQRIIAICYNTNRAHFRNTGCRHAAIGASGYQGLLGILRGCWAVLRGGPLLQHAQQATVVQEAFRLLCDGVTGGTAAPHSCSTTKPVSGRDTCVPSVTGCAMPCHAMLCYAMPCHAMLCYAMLCYAMLCCYAMLYCSELRCACLCLQLCVDLSYAVHLDPVCYAML